MHEPSIHEQAARLAASKISDDDLWSPTRIAEELANLSGWEPMSEFKSVLDSRRRQEARRKAIRWVDVDMPVEEVFGVVDYDLMFDFDPVRLRELLAEYDEKSKPFDYYDPNTKVPDYQRIKELSSILIEFGVDAKKREGLINVLTEYEFHLGKVNMCNAPISSADCGLLMPISSYLAQPELQSSYLTRFFANCFLTLLRTEAANARPLTERLSWNRTGMDKILEHLIAALSRFHEPTNRSRIDKILEHLIAGFSRLHEPATIDGRELTHQLRKLEDAGLAIPSVLFSLFRLTLPGI